MALIRCINYPKGCHWMDKACNLQAHLDICRYDSVSCPNDCTAMLSRMCLKDHLMFTCPRRRVMCQSCGQEFFGDVMETHQGNCPQEMVWCENKCGARLQRRFLNNHMRNECHKRTSSCPYCQKQFMYETLQNHYHQCPQFPVICPNRCDPNKIPREDVEHHVQTQCPCTLVPCSFRNAGCKHMCMRINLEKHLEENMKQHLLLMKQLVLKQEQQISSLARQLQQTCCITDGTFIWKITNFNSKLSEAKSSNKGLELKSDSFYAGAYGYKLGVSLFPNGNGTGEGSHLSLYIRVLPGEFDSLLEWPFHLPISFQLLDQCSDPDKQVHLKESFVPNPTWKHFQKPLKDTERAGFGYSRFVSQETLKNGTYIKDDAIFIKIKVDLASFVQP
ncbi:hypothetical protein LSH36_3g20055 [Paralvinella palmiformis]|uniref:TNF receptor-associated factor n=1 Tax=Paralvinella palmiformis TaxID=53620 RepID=A0AAD9KEY4_9ANNE|nr:hypothetical protein LSH36_3g20055 [Paralvinella palmiformis]